MAIVFGFLTLIVCGCALLGFSMAVVEIYSKLKHIDDGNSSIDMLIEMGLSRQYTLMVHWLLFVGSAFYLTVVVSIAGYAIPWLFALLVGVNTMGLMLLIKRSAH